MNKKYCLTIAVLVAVFIASSFFKGYAAETQDAPAKEDKVVATINNMPVKASELEAHAEATRWGYDIALGDLIDLKLLKTAATAKNIKMPSGAWTEEDRTRVEYDLARALSLNVPEPRPMLVVDHAWIKDSKNKKKQENHLALLEKMRELVQAGATMPAAFGQLKVDGKPWHIGDHEEYLYQTLPEKARNLPAGSVSGIIPGDGGQHLFKIWERKQSIPSSYEFSYILRSHLRSEAAVEINY